MPDPSISLHDDWQTTSVIASGYASSIKRVHLFEISVCVNLFVDLRVGMRDLCLDMSAYM